MSNSWDNVVGTDAYNKNLERIEGIANSNGHQLNPDEERVKKVIGLITMNFNEFGEYFCPCKQNHPLNPEEDITCPCLEIDEEIKKDGYCFCKLFFGK